MTMEMRATHACDGWFVDQPVRYYDEVPEDTCQQAFGGVELRQANLYFAERELDALFTDPDLLELDSVLSTTDTHDITSEGDDSLADESPKRRRAEGNMKPPKKYVTPTFTEATPIIHEEHGSHEVEGDHPWPPAEPSTTKSKSKRARPWTEEEHKQFLIGLKLYGRGDWRSVSRDCLKTRTPTQIASHAQKYFLRQQAKLDGAAGRRVSIHDICSVEDTLPMRKKRRVERQDEATSPVPTAQASPVTVYPVSPPQHEFGENLQSSTIPPADPFSVPVTMTEFGQNLQSSIMPPADSFAIPATMATLQAQSTMPHPGMLWPPSFQQLPCGMLVYSPPQPMWVLSTRAA